MSEGSTGASTARRGFAHKRERDPQEFYGGLALIGLAILGPILGLIFGSGTSGAIAGVYSLPIAVFGVAAMLFDVRNHQDFWGGVALVAFSLFALWAASDLPGMRGFAFGPGTAPRMFALLLAATGAGVALMGLLTDGPSPGRFSVQALLIVVGAVALWFLVERLCSRLPLPPAIRSNGPLFATVLVTALSLASIRMLDRFGLRGIFLLLLAILCFAVSIRTFGLVISSYVTVIVASAASREVSWIQSLIWAAVLTAFCSFLFPYALNLPLQLWPRF